MRLKKQNKITNDLVNFLVLNFQVIIFNSLIVDLLQYSTFFRYFLAVDVSIIDVLYPLQRYKLKTLNEKDRNL